MGPARRRKCLKVFRRLLELEPSRRRAALVERHGRDPELVAEVASLLDHHDASEAEDFLPPPSPSPTPHDATAPAEPAAADLPPGTRVGPYELGAVIGRGGMGVVYRARPASGSGPDVALKLVDRPVSDALARRFEAERQLLSRLEHPNVVRLLGGGTTDGGVPYLVMELADGLPLDRYAREHALTPRACVELVAPVLGALEYAHAEGVIHRDLKPSNVLVTHEGIPKVTDFGLARPLRGTGTATLTREGTFLGTPGYAAPEQILAEPHRNMPGVDVYSLGAILFRLLTGRHPHEAPTPFETCLRTVTEEAEHPRRFNRAVPRELDTVVAVATARDPSRRYATVRELAADLRRFLADERVLARPASRAERLGRWALRHHKGVLAWALTVLCLLLGTLAVLTRSNRELARKNDLLADLSAGYAATMERVATSGGTTDPRLRDEFGRFQGALDRLVRSGGDEATLVDVLYRAGLAHFQLARAERDAHRLVEARAHYAASIDLLRPLARDHPERHDVRYDLARSLWCFADQLPRGNKPRAVELHQEALDIIARLARDSGGDPDYRDAEANQRFRLGVALLDLGREEGVTELEAAAAVAAAISGAPDAPARYRRNVALPSGRLADWLRERGRPAEAQRLGRRAVDAGSALVRAEPENPAYLDEQAWYLRVLALTEADLGDPGAAERLLDDALAIRERLAREHPGSPEFEERAFDPLWLRAEVRLLRGRGSEAGADFAEAAARLTRFLNAHEDEPIGAGTFLHFAPRAAVLDRPEAEKLLALGGPALKADPADVDARVAVARALSALGRDEDAIVVVTREVPSERRGLPAFPLLAAASEARLGRREAALAHLEEGSRLLATDRRDSPFLDRVRREIETALLNLR